jgi:hypothetical protein
MPYIRINSRLHEPEPQLCPKCLKNEQGKQYRLRHPEKTREMRRNYRKKHPQYWNSYFRQKRVEIINLLGAKCTNCGCSDIRLLQIHHSKGNGKDDRYYLRILESVKAGSGDYKVLCANCHVLAHLEL